MKKIYIKRFMSLMLCALSTVGASIKADKTQFEANIISSQHYMYDSLSPDKQMEIVALYDSKTKYNNYKKNKFNNYMNFIRDFLFSESDPIIRLKKGFIIGIIFLDDGSCLVNSTHLKIIFQRCKSSINSQLQRMGLTVYKREMNPKNESSLDHIRPYFSGIFNEQIPMSYVRQWSKRVPASKPAIKDLENQDLKPIVLDYSIKNPTERQILSLAASLARSLEDYPGFRENSPLLAGGPYIHLPIKDGYERCELISQKLLSRLKLNPQQAPAILIRRDIRQKTSSYGNTPAYDDLEMKTYEEAGCEEEGLRAVFNLRKNDLIEAAKKCGFKIDDQPSPFLNVKMPISKITLNFNLFD